MKKFLLIICVFILLVAGACKLGGGGSEGCPDVSNDVTLLEQEVYDLWPSFDQYSVEEQVAMIRDYLHWLAKSWENGGIAHAPYRFEDYRKLRDQEIGALCGDFAYTFAAILQSVGIQARITQLASDTAYNGSWGHVVNEVWINGKWEWHDAMFGIRAESYGQRLSAREIQAIIKGGNHVEWVTDGYSVTAQAAQELENGTVPYEEYFDIIYEPDYHPPVFGCW